MDPKLMTPEGLEAVRARSPIEPWPANVWEGEMGGWCAVGPHRKRGDEGEDNDCFERAMDDARWIESARTDIPRLLSHIAALQAENERLRAALSEIERGRGPRSPDPLTHADNIIANLQRIAREALAGTWEPEE